MEWNPLFQEQSNNINDETILGKYYLKDETDSINNIWSGKTPIELLSNGIIKHNIKKWNNCGWKLMDKILILQIDNYELTMYYKNKEWISYINASFTPSGRNIKKRRKIYKIDK